MSYKILFEDNCFVKDVASATLTFKITDSENAYYSDPLSPSEIFIKVNDGSGNYSVNADIIKIDSEKFSDSLVAENNEYVLPLKTGDSFNWQQLRLSIDNPTIGNIEATVPYRFGIRLLKDVSYTNSIDGRLVHVPFKVVYPSDAYGIELTRQFNFSILRGAHTSGETNFSNSSANYPFQWSVNTLDHHANLNTSVDVMWNNAEPNDDFAPPSIERIGTEGNFTYYMNVPFGKSDFPTGVYIEVDRSVSHDSTTSLGGYYEKISSEYIPANLQPYNVYRMKDVVNNKYYFMLPMKIAYQRSYDSMGSPTYSLSFPDSDISPAYYFMAWCILASNVETVPATNLILSSSTDQQTSASNVMAIANDFIQYSGMTITMPDANKSFGKGYTTSTNNLTISSTGTLSITSGNIKNPDNDYFSQERNGAEQENGQEHEIYFSLKDSDGNTTVPKKVTMKVYQIKPSKLSLVVTGSSGSQNYTGYYVKHGRMFPSELVSVAFSAESNLDMTYRVYGDVKKEYSGNLVNMVSYKHIMKLDSHSDKDYGKNPLLYPLGTSTKLSRTKMSIHLEVTDEAGNTDTLKRDIMWMPQLYRLRHLNLREPSSSDYSHKMSSQNSPILQRVVDTNNYTRSWNEIWYPETHGSPTSGDGSVNHDEALDFAKNPTSELLEKYDPLALLDNGEELAKDTDGRYLQDVGRWDRTKVYPAKENSRLVNNTYQKYWIIDNSGNPDLQLEFEIFDFSSSITKFPENLNARTSGDSLSVFDASDPDCVYSNPVVDEYGRKHWVLKDSTKLSHLFTLKGSGFDKANNKPAIIDSDVGDQLEDTGNGFICPAILQCSRICIVPFTDYGTETESRASGFKLKAGKIRYSEYENYECIEETGEVWVHVRMNDSWTVPSNLEMMYDYYESKIDIDSDSGVASFTSRQVYPVLGTFSNYLYLYKKDERDSNVYVAGYPHSYFSAQNTGSNEQALNCIKTFATSQDDLQDYSSKAFYVSYMGTEPVKNQIYDPNVATNDSSGKFTAYSMDNDTGILKVNSETPPRGRLFADYYYHTFYRLTSDGYGDLYFYGNGILVPASATKSYTDWTYVDLKIVNEGGNTLNDGTLTFLARGYITKGSVVDTVLDQNRPWDVQEGTTAETVNRTGARYSTSFSNLDATYPANRATAFDARSEQSLSFGTIEPKQTIFVRVFWCIAQNAAGTAWIDCSRGNKCYSGELSGTYFIFTS
jgi:hypothetical protein